jgi:hypothetical protein
MLKECEVMRKIHQIQRKIYKEEKGLSKKELIAKIHREAQKAIKKYGFKFKKPAKTHH